MASRASEPEAAAWRARVSLSGRQPELDSTWRWGSALTPLFQATREATEEAILNIDGAVEESSDINSALRQAMTLLLTRTKAHLH